MKEEGRKSEPEVMEFVLHIDEKDFSPEEFLQGKASDRFSEALNQYFLSKYQNNYKTFARNAELLDRIPIGGGSKPKTFICVFSWMIKRNFFTGDSLKQDHRWRGVFFVKIEGEKIAYKITFRALDLLSDLEVCLAKNYFLQHSREKCVSGDSSYSLLPSNDEAYSFIISADIPYYSVGENLEASKWLQTLRYKIGVLSLNADTNPMEENYECVITTKKDISFFHTHYK